MAYIGNPIYQSAFVTDQFSGTGSQTAYTMSVAPAGTTNVLVVVSGVVQDPSTYGVVGNTLTFSAAPPSGTGNISCRYLGVPVTGVTTTAYRTKTEFTATAGQTTFTPPSYTVGYIDVYLNGVLLGAADYTASNGTTVVLTTGAAAGNLVTTVSMLVSSVLNALPQSGGTLSGNLVVTGTETIGGLLGVGTNSPATYNGLLNVKGSDAAVLGYFGGTTYASRHGANSSFATIEGVDAATGVSSYQPLQIGGSLLSMATGGTERMRINASGQVTMPYQPGFGSYNNTSYTLSGTNTKVTTWVTNLTGGFNNGSNFNTSTGRFTAPVAGKYYFTATMLPSASANVSNLWLFINGALPTGFLFGYTQGSGTRVSLTQTAIFSLSVGDYVEVYIGSSSNTFDNSGNFSGWLLG